MTGIELAELGKCGACHAPLHHGPWSDEQITAVIADLGEPEFEDWCDQCMVNMCFGGDAKHAANLLGRPMSVGLSAVLGVM